MTAKLTHEEWEALVDPTVFTNYDIVSEYTGSKQPIKLRCKFCGGIVDCSANYAKTITAHSCKYLLPSDIEAMAKPAEPGLPRNVDEAITYYLGEVPDNIQILTSGTFRGVEMVLEAHCDVHNKRFRTSIKNLLRGKCECKACVSELFQHIRTLLKDRYSELGITQVFTLHNRGEYHSLEQLRFRHNECGATFKDSLQHMLENPTKDNCPHCRNVSQEKSSLLEMLTTRK